MRSTISAFVIVIRRGSSGSELQREAARQPLEHARVQRVHLVVGERAIRRAIRDRVGEALLAGRDGCAAVAVEQPHRLDLLVAQGADLLDDVAGTERLVDDDGEVANDGGESRYSSERDAARNIVADLREVKLGDPHFRWKIAGLDD